MSDRHGAPLDKRGDGSTTPSGKDAAWKEQLAALHRVAASPRLPKWPLDPDELGRAEDTYGVLPSSLSVNSGETPFGLGGYDRPTEEVRNVAEVVARYRENADPAMYCGYCAEHAKQGMRHLFRSKDVRNALEWFRNHDCIGEGEHLPVLSPEER